MVGTLLVERLIATSVDTTDLRQERWSFALDQRAFGPRRLLVAFAKEDGQFVGLAHTARTDPPVDALVACVAVFGAKGCAAVAFSDEPVANGPPAPDTEMRFEEARAMASAHGVRLVDWICCEDHLFRSMRVALWPDADPWEDGS